MSKKQLRERNKIKSCYGTHEWSENSGICCGCEWKEDCGKIKNSKTAL